MATARFSERDLMKRVTMTVTVYRPVHHRLLFWLGRRCFALGAWLMGAGALRIEDDA